MFLMAGLFDVDTMKVLELANRQYMISTGQIPVVNKRRHKKKTSLK
jgi:hypothetical protein